MLFIQELHALAICFETKFKKKSNLDASDMGLSLENLVLLDVNNKGGDYAACISVKSDQYLVCCR